MRRRSEFTVISTRPLPRHVIRALRQSYEINKRFFSFEIPHFNVVICHTPNEWKKESKYYHFPFARGLVLRDGTVVMKSMALGSLPLRKWQSVATHEMNHVYWCHLSRRGRDLWSPIWLLEGLACTAGNNYPARSPRAVTSIIEKIGAKNLLPFRYRAALFKNRNNVRHYYTVWRYFVEWVFRKHRSGLRRFLKNLRKIDSKARFDREMERCFGGSTGELFVKFRKFLAQ